MRIQSRAVLLVAGLVVAVAVIFYLVDSYRHRFVRENHAMLAFLPGGDVTTFYADLAALRSANLLQVLSGSKPGGEAEYNRFVQETQFDYSKDLDAVAGAATGTQTFVLARGRFDWNKLQQYAQHHGGTCRHDICRMPASQPGRWVSFLPIQTDVIAVALSADEDAVEQLTPEHRRAPEPVLSGQPIWVELSKSLRTNPLSLPLGVRIFAVALQSADEVILSVGRSADNSHAAFNLELDARCPNAATAASTRNQLEIETKMLNIELTREHAQANPADLTGLLTSGAFQVIGNRVVGTWPVRKELLNTLQ